MPSKSDFDNDMLHASSYVMTTAWVYYVCHKGHASTTACLSVCQLAALCKKFSSDFHETDSLIILRMGNWTAWYREHSAVTAIELMQPRDLSCETLFFYVL